MSFKGMLDQDIDVVFFEEDGFSDNAVYIVYSDSSEKNILVMHDLMTDLEAYQKGQKAVSIFYLKESQVTDPKYRDKIKYKGVTWTIEKIVENGSGIIQVLARTDVRAAIR